MKFRYLFLLSAVSFFAQAASADMQADILAIQQQWAKANYDTAQEAQEAAFEALVRAAHGVAERYPDRAEPKVWQAICLSTQAGVTGGLGALSKVGKARDLLLAAEKIDANVLQGSIYTSLGSLYYQVPGWPIGFGDDDEAEKYLQKALASNPTGIDPNYFYGDFMIEEGKYKEAVDYLQRALQAPARPERPLADAGRRKDVQAKLAEARRHL